MFIEMEIYTREMEEVSLITVLCKDIHVLEGHMVD